MCTFLPFCFEGGMGDLIELIPAHCLPIYFTGNYVLPLPFSLAKLSVSVFT